MDNASTTRVDDEVANTYTLLLEDYYNPDALYDGGVSVFKLQEKSRKVIAELLHVKAEDLIFTSGASEANNTIIKGLSMLHRGGHIISSYYEHSSVFEAIKQVEEYLDIEVTYLMPDKDGHIEPNSVKEALRPNTFLVTIMAVNNEVGTINDIRAISEVTKAKPQLVFHSDMTQAIGKVAIDLSLVDAASFSVHKINGVKGSGLLYKRQHIAIAPLISAGQQEFHLRGGTSNAPANIVLAKTIRKTLDRLNDRDFLALDKYLHEGLVAIPGIKINIQNDVPGILSISTPLKTEVMINALDLEGIMVSGKSTCGSRENTPSRTLEALGIDGDYTIRLSLGHHNTKEEVDRFLEVLKEIIARYEY